MQVERVRLVQGDGHQRVQRWRRGHPAGAGAEHVTVGTLVDGRWYVASTALAGEAEAFGDEQAARAYAAGLTAGGEWVETPANFDARQQPLPPGTWARYGGEWIRDDG